MKPWLKHIFIISITVHLISCQNGIVETPVEIDLTKDIVIPKTYILSKCDAPIIIDGIANEDAWENVQFTDDFIDIEGEKIPHFRTKLKMMWDESNLYIYAELEEPHIWGDITDRDQIIYLNNDFEVFIDPACDTHNYGEIEINALGTEWDLFLDKPYSIYGNPIFNWDIDNLETAVKLYGTINDYSDIDSMWTVEMAIPLKTLVELKKRPTIMPVDGEEWRINFSRVEWDYEIFEEKYRRKQKDGEIYPEYNWVWSPHYEINMHQPDKWGIIRFSDDSRQANREFELDDQSYAKQIAYAAFRKTRFSDIKELNDILPYTSKLLRLKISEEETIKAVYTKTKFGFEIAFEKNGVSYIINEEGVLKIEDEE